MNTQQWALAIYNNEGDYLLDELMDTREYIYKCEHFDTMQEVTDAAFVAEYQGYWTRIFAPDGELVN